MSTTAFRSDAVTLDDITEPVVGREGGACVICREPTEGRPVYKVVRCICDARGEAKMQRSCQVDVPGGSRRASSRTALCSNFEVHVRCSSKADEAIEKSNVENKFAEDMCGGCGAPYDYCCCEDEYCEDCGEPYDYCVC